MPFGPDCQYEDFDACKRANADRDDPDAYCAAIQKRTEEHCMSNRIRDIPRFTPQSAGEAVKHSDLSRLQVVGDFSTFLAAAAEDGRPRLRLARPIARQARPWYRITAKADEGGGGDRDEPTTDGDTTIIDIYDEIGWFGTGAAEFIADLRQVATPKIELHINSPGGDVFDAIAIYNGLRQHKAQVHAIVDSLAASAASFIAMAGDKITAMANAMMMIHDPLGLVIGNAADMRELADLLDKHGDNIAAIYATRAGGEVADWRERMLAETWYLADEAYKAGLVDEVDEADGRPVEDAWDLSVFAHQPDAARPAAAATEDPPSEEAPTVEESTAREDAPPHPAATPVTVASDASRSRSYLGEPPPWHLPQSNRKENVR